MIVIIYWKYIFTIKTETFCMKHCSNTPNIVNNFAMTIIRLQDDGVEIKTKKIIQYKIAENTAYDNKEEHFLLQKNNIFLNT